MLPEPVQILFKVTTVLDRLGIPYFVGGSLASAIYGFVRATADVDIIADIQPAQVQQLVNGFEKEFYIDPEAILDSILHASSFNLIHLETMFKVDVFVLKQRPFDENQMQRRILQPVKDISGRMAFFSSAEDIILAKMEWFRAGGNTSERQWRDILGIIELQADRLDVSYLQKWALDLGVSDLLKKAFRELDLDK